MLFSEPMSINFDPPSRYSTYNKDTGDISRSVVEENKHSLSKEHSDDEFEGNISNISDLQEVILSFKERKRSRSFTLAENAQLPTNHQLVMSKLPKMHEIQERLHRKPFKRAISVLKKINDMEGPMMKVRLLEQVNQLIKDEITQFWQGIPINESHLTITQDTKIPLYIFIVIRAKIVNLAAHIKFIQEFTTNYVHENNLGSNLALYESAMTIVADTDRNTIYNVIDQNDVYRTALANFQSFVTSVFDEDIDPFVEFSEKKGVLEISM